MKMTVFWQEGRFLGEEHISSILLYSFFNKITSLSGGARVERAGDGREMLKAGMRNFELSEPE